MSHTIVYERQFLKLTNGYIPIAFYGSSNVTVRNANGREVLERSWGTFAYGDGMIGGTQEHIMSVVRALHQEGNDGFRMNGKFLTDAQVIRWFENGIRRAMTIEEIRVCRPGIMVDCHLSVWNGSSRSQEAIKLCSKTEEIETWLEELPTRLSFWEELGGECYIFIAYCTSKPLHTEMASTQSKEGPVIAKRKKMYVAEYTENSITHTRDITAAHVFESAKEALEKLPRTLGPYHFVNADAAKKKAAEKNIVLKVSEGPRAGTYIMKLTAKSLSFCYTPEYAKRFSKESEAMKWYEEKVKGRFVNITGVTAEIYEKKENN